MASSSSGTQPQVHHQTLHIQAQDSSFTNTITVTEQAVKWIFQILFYLQLLWISASVIFVTGYEGWCFTLRCRRRWTPARRRLILQRWNFEQKREGGANVMKGNTILWWVCYWPTLFHLMYFGPLSPYNCVPPSLHTIFCQLHTPQGQGWKPIGPAIRPPCTLSSSHHCF